MKKEYWFYIDTYVHVAVKKDAVLFYNSYTGKILEYSGSPEISALIKRLLAPKNLRVVRLKAKDLGDPVTRSFVDKIREYYMGDLLDVSFSGGKPIQAPPIVKVQKDVKFLKGEAGRSVGEDMMKYLSTVSLYITDRCNQACDICTGAFRQFPCCTAGKKLKHDLTPADIKGVADEIENRALNSLDILGGDIFMHPELETVLEIINGIQAPKTYHLHYLNAAAHLSQLSLLAAPHAGGSTLNHSRLKIPVHFPVEEGPLKAVIDAVAGLGMDTVFCFIVRGAEDFEKAQAMIARFQIAESEFHVFYDGNNLDFFKENVFVDKEDIESIRPTLQEIYAREKINSIYFGHLTVRSNGRVYAAMNSRSLGSLGKHSFYDIVFKEMSNGASWRKTRKHITPCKHCTYELLCPPISNYNFALGMNNLCHIKW